MTTYRVFKTETHVCVLKRGIDGGLEKFYMMDGTWKGLQDIQDDLIMNFGTEDYANQFIQSRLRGPAATEKKETECSLSTL